LISHELLEPAPVHYDHHEVGRLTADL